MLTLTKSKALWQTAAQVLPNGVTSNFRYWGPEETRYLEGGRCAHVRDVDGNEYIDYRLGYGPNILGHGDARVDEAVIEAAKKAGIPMVLTGQRHFKHLRAPSRDRTPRSPPRRSGGTGEDSSPSPVDPLSGVTRLTAGLPGPTPS